MTGQSSHCAAVTMLALVTGMDATVMVLSAAMLAWLGDAGLNVTLAVSGLADVHAAVASLPPTMRRKPIKSTIWKDYDRKQLNLLILFTLPIFVPDL